MVSLQTDESTCNKKGMHYCRVCQKETKQIPIRKIGSLIIIEDYCPCCDESTMRYEKIQVIENTL